MKFAAFNARQKMVLWATVVVLALPFCSMVAQDIFRSAVYGDLQAYVDVRPSPDTLRFRRLAAATSEVVVKVHRDGDLALTEGSLRGWKASGLVKHVRFTGETDGILSCGSAGRTTLFFYDRKGHLLTSLGLTYLDSGGWGHAAGIHTQSFTHGNLHQASTRYLRAVVKECAVK